MASTPAANRAAVIPTLVATPPADVLLLRDSFSKFVSYEWRRHVLPVVDGASLGSGPEQAAKVRFMAEMYARACYSMLLVSARGPYTLRSIVRIATRLPVRRRTAVRFGCVLLSFLKYLVRRPVHRQLALMATLMGVMDLTLDDVAPSGQASVLRVASMLTARPPATDSPGEITLGNLARSIRAGESAWQNAYWDQVLVPAVREYCSAEALAVSGASDPTGLGYRWPGIEAAIKGMWYVIGPQMGLGGTLDFQQSLWNPEQRWMADTSLLMQMIDDWVDQDADCSRRPTPVSAGVWQPQTIQKLYDKTTADLRALLDEGGIHNEVFQCLFTDLYTDYLFAAIEAMESGLAT